MTPAPIAIGDAPLSHPRHSAVGHGGRNGSTFAACEYLALLCVHCQESNPRQTVRPSKAPIRTCADG